MATQANSPRFWVAALFALVAWPAVSAEEAGELTYDFVNNGEFRFGGITAERSGANIENWLLTAPRANPGMLGMFQRRDRQPRPDLVPWAGEFVGKYLISAIQSLRMSEDPRLEASTSAIIRELLTMQDADGYLGPWPREERLLGQWDLWGHYHVMLALLMWHERTGDSAALDACRQMADLVCDTYLDTGRRVLDAGSHEMNMAIIHSLGWLYRLTTEPRYLAMMRHIETDFEQAGDYVRAGLNGVEFHLTPRPRWESLHDIQGLVELYRITGDEAYRTAFVNTWLSIAHRDIHPSGGFTTGEQAVGNPYSEGAIETCCTIAWMALTQDMLRLTGDPEAAEYLDLAYWNVILGAQHPSGRWWTYDTPMNGSRHASAHHIVFQARAGTPELNCCSVNAPRGLGMLTEWAIMTASDGLVVNTYAPVAAALPLPGGGTAEVQIDSNYPVGGDIDVTVDSRGAALTLALRIPSWAQDPQVLLNGSPVEPAVRPGEYCRLTRVWMPDDSLSLSFGMGWRVWPGELGRSGHAAVYRGPLLMAFDTRTNDLDVPDLPAIDCANLAPEPTTIDTSGFEPMAAYRVVAADGAPLTLIDYASAGAHGTPYAAWLPAVNAPPAPFHLVRPLPGSIVPVAPTRFEWVGFPRPGEGVAYRLEIARDPEFTEIAAAAESLPRARAILPDAPSDAGTYYWRVIATNAVSSRVNEGGPWSFSVDPSLPPDPTAVVRELATGPGGVLASAPLAGSGAPSYGELLAAEAIEPCEGPDGSLDGAVRFDGSASMLRYALPHWPEEDYSLAVWVRPGDCSADRLHQIFSAWRRPMDDPLRVYLRRGQLIAGWEANGQGAGTPGIDLPSGEWCHVAVVKAASQLTLYLNGSEAATVRAPAWCLSMAQDFALGGNPHYTGQNEHYAGDLADFALYARALTAEEVAEAARR